MDFRFKDFINQTMLLCDGSRPLAGAVAFERFRMSCACKRVHSYLVEQINRFLERCRFILLQLGKPLLGTWGIGNRVHSLKCIKPCIHLIQIGKGDAFTTLDLFACLVNASKKLFFCHQSIILLLGCPRGLLQTGCKPFPIVGCKRKALDVIPQVIHCNSRHNALVLWFLTAKLRRKVEKLKSLRVKTS